jgi:DNA-binding transcriptional regulator YiaG
VLEKIAGLFEVDVTDLLDEYNLFLFVGQAEQLKAFRKKAKVTQATLAVRLGVSKTTVKRWEQGKVRMMKKTWNIIFNE